MDGLSWEVLLKRMITRGTHPISDNFRKPPHVYNLYTLYNDSYIVYRENDHPPSKDIFVRSLTGLLVIEFLFEEHFKLKKPEHFFRFVTKMCCKDLRNCQAFRGYRLFVNQDCHSAMETRRGAEQGRARQSEECYKECYGC